MRLCFGWGPGLPGSLRSIKFPATALAMACLINTVTLTFFFANYERQPIANMQCLANG